MDGPRLSVVNSGSYGVSEPYHEPFCFMKRRGVSFHRCSCHACLCMTTSVDLGEKIKMGIISQIPIGRSERARHVNKRIVLTSMSTMSVHTEIDDAEA